MRNKTGTHVFWENGVHYPRVFPGAHPLTKKPEESGYEIAYVFDMGHPCYGQLTAVKTTEVSADTYHLTISRTQV